jgi:hypothetical protein
MLITPLLETDVVVGADAREHRYLLASQAGRAATPEIPKADFLGLDKFTARPEILADHVRRWHATPNDTTPETGQHGVSLQDQEISWWAPSIGSTLAA